MAVVLTAVALGCETQTQQTQPTIVGSNDTQRWVKAREEQRACERHLVELESKVRMDDWRKWFDYYHATGYRDEETALKADRMMRGR